MGREIWYVVTADTLRLVQARHAHLCSYCGNLTNVCVCVCVCVFVCVCVCVCMFVYHTFVVVPVVSVQTRIICTYVFILHCSISRYPASL